MSRLQSHGSYIAVEGRESHGEADPAEFVLAVLVVASLAALAFESLRPEPIDLGGLRIDRMTALLGFMLSGVGFLTTRFAWRALAGDPARVRTCNLLAATVVAGWVAAVGDVLPLVIGGWIAQGVFLHRLLTVRHDRVEAAVPARIAFVVGRIGDVCLVGLAAIAWREHGTWSISGLVASVGSAGSHGGDAVALLLALAAIARSVQFPFHSWLPDTMEAPTPVSAVMHAGVVNAGGILLVRCMPLIGASSLASGVLVLVGCATMLVAMPAMWAQVKVKRELAWSTIAQMGFMIVQCGMLLVPAAMLHILGHGCYKAWAFLHSGQVPAPAGPPPRPARAALLLAAGVGSGAGAVIAGASWAGLDLRHSPGEASMAAALALGVGHVWVAIAGTGQPSPAGQVGRAAWCAAVAVAAGIGGPLAWTAVSRFLEPTIGAPTAVAGALGWALAGLVTASLVVLSALHVALPVLDRHPRGFAFHVHALNGFYLGTAWDRLVATSFASTPRRMDPHGHA